MANEEKLLIRIQAVFSFASGFASIFLTIFLFKLGGFSTVALFNLFFFIGIFFLFFLSGKLLKILTTNILIQIGFILLTLFYLFIFVLRNEAIHSIILLGFFNGIGHGFFWPSFNLSQYILTKEKTRNTYFGHQFFESSLASFIAPLLAGGIISFLSFYFVSTIGYAVVFFITILLMTCLIFLSYQLPSHSGVAFSLMDFVLHKRSKRWFIVLWQQFLFGLWDSAFSNFSAILLFIIFKTEFYLGITNTITCIISALSSLFAGKILQKYPQYYHAGTILPALGLVLFAFQQNIIGVISLTIFYFGFLSFLKIPTSANIYNVMDEDKKPWQQKFHFHIERDSVLGIGRITSFLLLLILFSISDKETIATTWIFIIPVLLLLTGWLQWYLIRINK